MKRKKVAAKKTTHHKAKSANLLHYDVTTYVVYGALAFGAFVSIFTVTASLIYSTAGK
jgi:hypothetical protein